MSAPVSSASRLLLDGLNEAIRTELFSVGTEVCYRSGQIIHRHGDHDRSLQIILEGKVRFSRLDEDGRQASGAVLGQGESFGEIPLLTGRSRTHNAAAVGRVRLLHISYAQFQALLTRQPDIRDRLLVELAERLALAADMLDNVIRFTVPQRVAQFLVAQAEHHEPRHPIVLRQSDIADALSVTREAVAAALRRFREAGLIETRYRAICVMDLEGLRSATGRH
ncbi:Crp/Fnr family transcriptional regulator [Paraburkholderia sediminicola]|uniref:Crp/Fnr family transcriptional regulator n=1 Tax=Paraburkholderia sediminicola TaxID=458836 RepID=UPI0038BB7E8C